MKHAKQIMTLVLAAGLLTGCKNSINPVKKSGNDDSNKVVFQKIKHRQGHLSSKNLTPKMTAAAISVYAGKKYPDSWGKVLDKGEKDGLNVSFENRSNYSYMHEGTGISYMLSEDCGYTLKQDGNDTRFYIFANQNQLESKTLTQIVDYLNDHDGEELVKKLAGNITLGASSKENSDTDSASSKTHIKGDGGLFDIPEAMQGTWYTYIDGKLIKTVIDDHHIGDDGQTTELHIQTREMPEKYLDDGNSIPKSYLKETQNWSTAGYMNLHGIKWLNTRGWIQGAGDGEFYGLKTEEGQTALVVAGGAGVWTTAVCWRNVASAQKYAHKKFSNLCYQ